MKLTLLIAIVFCCFSISAQTAKELVYKNYTVKDGLPSNEVYDVLQDDAGYIWFATDRGVSRFDGNQFENFSSKNGLIDNVVFQFYKDEKGNIWFITKSNRLFYWDGQKINRFKFNRIIIEKCIGNYFTNYIEIKNNVIELHINGNGIFWFDESGLIKAEYDNQKERKIIFNSNKSKNGFSFTGFQRKGELERFVINENEVESIDTLLKLNNYSRLCRNFYGHGVQGMFMGKNLFLHCIRNREKTKVNHFVTKELIQEVEVINDSTLILCLKNSGIKKIMFDNNGYDLIDHGFKEYNISNVLYDKSNNLWITTINSGVIFIDNNRTEVIKNLNEISVYNSIRYLNKNVDILINSNNDIFKYERETITKISDNRNNSKLFLLGQNLCGRINNQLVKIDSNLNIEVVAENILAECKGGFIFLKDTFIFSSNHLSKIREGRIHSQKLISVTKSYQHKNKQYLLSQGKLFEFSNDSCKKLTIDYPNFYHIDDVLSYKDSVVYIALRGVGIAELKDKKIFELNVSGRTLNYIDKIYEHKSGIYVKSQNTIMRLAVLGENRFKYETILDGKNIPYQIYDVLVKENKLMLATSIGLVSINLRTPNKQGTYFYISEVLVNYSPVSIKNIENLKYSQNNLEFKFKVVEFSKNEVQFRYKIKENDPWTYTMDDNFGFKNLKSDDYFLILEYSLDNENWVSALNIRFTINKPFWKTIWFYSVIVLVLIFILIIVFKRQNINQKKKEGLALAALNSRQEALRSQMNPHFIFNSMNSIQSAILNREYRQANNYLVGFSKYLRKTLNNSREELITLQEDISNIELYVKVEKFRFKDKFDFEILILDDLNLENYMVPPLIAQPFIENSIIHGVTPKDGKGQIVYSLRKQNRKLVFSIRDNGVGFQNKKKEYKSLGSEIVKERFKGFEQKYNIDLKIYINQIEINGNIEGVHVDYELPLIERKKYD